MNDGLDSIGPEHPIAWASASATILILQLQASKMLHKTHAWNQAGRERPVELRACAMPIEKVPAWPILL